MADFIGLRIIRGFLIPSLILHQDTKYVFFTFFVYLIINVKSCHQQKVRSFCLAFKWKDSTKCNISKKRCPQADPFWPYSWILSYLTYFQNFFCVFTSRPCDAADLHLSMAGATTVSASPTDNQGSALCFKWGQSFSSPFSPFAIPWQASSSFLPIKPSVPSSILPFSSDR